MAKRKFYVVWKGRKPGIYTTWDECAAQVSGFTGAEFKAFPSRAAADAAFSGEYETYAGKSSIHTNWLFAPKPPIIPSVCVDAACSGSPGPLEYRCVDTETGKEFFRRGPFAKGTNNVGEFLALVHALSWLEHQGISIPIYSDSVTAMSWIRKMKCGTKLSQTATNAELFELIARAEDWLAEHAQGDWTIKKWDTAAWGEIPADFGRK